MRKAVVIGWCIAALLSAAGGPAWSGEGDDLFHRGIIEPSEVIEVSSQVPGIIESVAVERGERIRGGQTLAVLKSGVETAQVELARARLDFGKRRVLRNEELYQKQMISIHEKDEMETEVRIMELQLQEALERLKLRTIVSPVTGTVVERHLGPGEYIGEGSIMRIARINPLNVEVVVPVDLYGTIAKGMKAEVRPELPLRGVFQGTVVIVDEVIDAASGTFGVRVELSNPDHRLPAGLNCTVRFQ
ncbi:MAG: efflux RND transporter periplasmic adaptor subunit [Syntrophales bacterium]|jgi:RND family efflux transporter MFP subunit|nr:efflux RND transporter periplasmic adaptor subunit [Syntrophales bacterium]MCK9528445.1 efflux RND transporter periplasmic adaptor subunit [Syntrophales bacterium]MDX9922468.1 efflux RND transporter periplasmic adaptor subunit [Syntrophales bacterium]